MIKHEKSKMWYITQENRYNTGQARTAYIRHFVEIYIALALYAKIIMDRELTIPLIVIIFICIVVGYWIIGYIWDIIGMIILAAEFGNRRNKYVIEMRKKMGLIK